MLSFLPGTIRGILAFILLIVNTIYCFIPLMIFAILKLILRIKICQKILDKILIFLASGWVERNALILRLMHKIKWDVTGAETLSMKNWYLVISNHQSWVDIIVIQTVLLNKIPYLKFFLKKELIWVPVMGIAWWALDFPFMKRYSQDFIRKNPQLKGKDLEITRKACQKFRTNPISIMNFVEGTRFTDQKHNKQGSSFKHLLKPKAGGIAFVLGAMGDCLQTIIDITIVYPEGIQNFWDLLCGRVTHVKVDIQTTDITDDLKGDYFDDADFQAKFQEWINDLWEKKDQKIDSMFLCN